MLQIGETWKHYVKWISQTQSKYCDSSYTKNVGRFTETESRMVTRGWEEGFTGTKVLFRMMKSSRFGWLWELYTIVNVLNVTKLYT
jgi:hypothetical protein